MAAPAPHRWQSTHPPLPDSQKILKVPLDVLTAPFRAVLTPAQQVQLQREFYTHGQQGGCPALVYNQVIDHLGALVLPTLAPAAARQRIGYEAARAAPTSSIIGRILVAPLRVMGPSRLCQYIPKAWGSIVSYGTQIAWEAAPQHWYIDMTEEPLYLDYIQGSFEAAGVELAKVAGWRVVGTVQGPQHYLFSVTW